MFSMFVSLERFSMDPNRIFVDRYSVFSQMWAQLTQFFIILALGGALHSTSWGPSYTITFNCAAWVKSPHLSCLRFTCLRFFSQNVPACIIKQCLNYYLDQYSWSWHGCSILSTDHDLTVFHWGLSDNILTTLEHLMNCTE